MIIVAMERQPRRRARVEVSTDDGRRFDVSRALARERGLRAGRPIDTEEIDELVALDARREALRSAGSMLARSQRSERELRRRLAMRRFDGSVIAETIDRLRAAGLVNDRQFAESWVEARDHRRPRGRRLAAAELRAHGIDAATAIAAAGQISEEDAAYRAAGKHLRTLRNADYPRFRRGLAACLQRRGFGWDTIRATIDRCWRECGGGAADEDALDDLEGAME